MNLLNPNRLEMSGANNVTTLAELVIDTLDHYAAKISAAWQIEHGPQGEHADVTLAIGSAVDYETGAGIWMAPSLVTGLYQFRVGDPAGNQLTWDGTNLSVTGAINATSGSFTGEITAESGVIGGWEITASTIQDAGGDVILDSTGSITAGSVTLDSTGVLVAPSHNGFTASGAYRFGTNWGTYADFSDGGPTYVTELRTEKTTTAIVQTTLRATSDTEVATFTVEANDPGGSATATATVDTFFVSGDLDVSGNGEVDGDLVVNTTLITNGGLEANGDSNFRNIIMGTAYSFRSGAINNANDFTHLIPGQLSLCNTNTGTEIAISFQNNNGVVGEISTNGTTTTYATTSDATLKRDLGIAKESKLAAIKVRDYEWITGGAVSRGVFAQEAFATHPDAVVPGDDMTGRPWMVDYSKFVPDLIVGWQQHEARLAALEARR